MVALLCQSVQSEQLLMQVAYFLLPEEGRDDHHVHPTNRVGDPVRAATV